MKRIPLRMGIIVFFIFVVLCLVWFLLPVCQFNYDIKYVNGTSHTNDTDYIIAKATLENDYRTNGLQVLGGILVIAGLIFTYSNYVISRDDQLTNRYNSAIKKLGQEKVELKLSGIIDLETISQEYDKYYWSIMEILTAYVRNNSSVNIQLEEKSRKVVTISMDIEANESTKIEVLKMKTVPSEIQKILDVIVKRKHSFGSGETNHLNLQRTNLQYTNLSDGNLSGANLSEANLKRANLSEANFKRANLSEANFEGAILASANLSEAILSRANLSNALLASANLSEAILSRANLSNALLSGANLEEANLSGANLYWIILSKANLSGAILSWADLSQAELYKADLSQANLSGANLSGANLSGANLSGANLSGANFEGAILSGANFEGAILSGANFEGANLEGVILPKEF